MTAVSTLVVPQNFQALDQRNVQLLLRDCVPKNLSWRFRREVELTFALPPNARDAHAAETIVYGYLLATVSPSGEIHFDFKRLAEKDVPAAITNRYKSAFVHWCFAENSQARSSRPRKLPQ